METGDRRPENGKKRLEMGVGAWVQMNWGAERGDPSALKREALDRPANGG